MPQAIASVLVDKTSTLIASRFTWVRGAGRQLRTRGVHRPGNIPRPFHLYPFSFAKYGSLLAIATGNFSGRRGVGEHLLP